MIHFSAQLMRKAGERFLQDMQAMIDDAIDIDLETWEVLEKPVLCPVRVK